MNAPISPDSPNGRLSQLNFAELFDVIVDAVIAIDEDQRILFFNKGAEDIFGYTAEEALGRPLDMLLPQPFVEVHRRHIDNFAASPVASRTMAERQPVFAVTKTGREFPAEAAIAKMQQNGETIFVVILRDITERKRTETELRTQAEQIAIAAERSRLARDLHDAVTQTLFSASVIADVLPRIWERNPDEGKRRLNELRQLSRGALAEMRTLLLELRPSALMEANLSDLLRQFAASITSRAGVVVDVRIDGHADLPLPPDVKVSLYRIAQEALNNVAKHSGASHAWVELIIVPAGPNGDGDSSTRASASARAPEPAPTPTPVPAHAHIRLSIRDDGSGFDTSISKPIHLGLDIMRERADATGAELKIESEIGKGTEVSVVLDS